MPRSPIEIDFFNRTPSVICSQFFGVVAPIGGIGGIGNPTGGGGPGPVPVPPPPPTPPQFPPAPVYDPIQDTVGDPADLISTPPTDSAMFSVGQPPPVTAGVVGVAAQGNFGFELAPNTTLPVPQRSPIPPAPPLPFGQILGRALDLLTRPQPSIVPSGVPTFTPQPVDLGNIPSLTPQPSTVPSTLPNFRPQPNSGNQPEIVPSNQRSVTNSRLVLDTKSKVRIDDEISRGQIPSVDGVDPPELPDLGVMGPSASAASDAPLAVVGDAPCLACTLTEEEREKLLDGMPAESVEVSFMCPNADEAEKLSLGVSHACIPI